MNNLFILTLLISFTGIAYGLRCYDCFWNEDNDNVFGSDKNCRNKKDLKDSHLITCPGTFATGKTANTLTSMLAQEGEVDAKAIKTLCIKADGKANNKTQLERACYRYEETSSGKCVPIPDHGIFKNYTGCLCDKDKCNGSSNLVPKILVTIILTMMGKLLLF